MFFSQAVAFITFARDPREDVAKVYRQLVRMNFEHHPDKEEILTRFFDRNVELEEGEIGLRCLEADRYEMKFYESAKDNPDQFSDWIKKTLDPEAWSDK